MKELIKKILREQEETVSLKVKSAWPELRKQNEKRMRDWIEAAEWELLTQGLEIPEEEFEEPQVIKDLYALIKAIEEGKTDSHLMRTKNFKRLNLDKDKIAYWRNHLDKPEPKSVWVRVKDKIEDWLDGGEGKVASDEETKELDEHIKKTLKEFKKSCPKGMYFCDSDNICKPESQKMGDINNTGDMELNEVGFTTDYSQEVIKDLDSFIEVVKGPISELRQQKSFPTEVNAHLIQRLYGLLSEGGELHEPTQELIDILSELDDKPEKRPIGFRMGGNY
jgi:hypothetical protein